MNRSFVARLTAMVGLLTWASFAQAQCVVINEIMINGGTSYDGSNAPFTEEWVELYNTCSVPTDISCFTLTDGDFALTFPTGTIIPANGHFVIGSDNSLVPVNLNWASCGCTSGTSIGIFTNGNEQLVLSNNAGTLVDAIYWGSGQFPVNITTPALGTCATNNIFYATATPAFENFINGGGNGCSWARACDGSDTWEERCDPLTITGGATNGSTATPEFLADNTAICTGSCIGFTDDTPYSVTSWLWTFEGAQTTSSTDQNPANICYNNAGSFDVTLTVTSACGTATQTVTDMITVADGSVATISPSGFITLCPGQSQTLSITGTFASIQWQEGGADIPGANGLSYTATTSGEYTVVTGSGACEGVSEPVVINVVDAVGISINPSSDVVLCPGETQVFTAGNGFDTYQWLLNGSPIPGANSATYTASTAGDYSVEVTSSGCSAESNPVGVSFTTNPTPSISPTSITLCPGQNTTIGTDNIYATYQWYQGNNPIANAITYQYNVSQSGTYYVIVTNASGCEGQSGNATVTVSSPAIPVIESSTGSFSFCDGESIDLSIESSFSDITWFVGFGISGSSTSINVNSSGIVYVTAQSAGCEVVSESINVVEVPAPTAVLSPSGLITTCNGSAVLTATSNGTVQWFFNDAPIIGANSNSYTATQEGVYYFVAINSNECVSVSNETELVFGESLVVSITASVTEFCQGGSAVLTVQSPGGNIEWSTGETTNSITVNSGDTYTVEVTNNQGCTGTASIEISEIPLPLVDAGNDTISDCSTGVMLNGTGNGTLEWSPAESLSDPFDPMPQANPSQTTTYTLTSTLGNCSNTDEVTVVVDCSSIYIPNVITPNNDGKNDFFEVIARGVKTFEIKIYNRWGNLIFESTDPDRKWDGGVNQFYVSDGTYVYTVVALDFQNKPILDEGHSHGTITVIR